MCGHVGIAGKLEMRDEATMKRLLVFDYFRGPDSTGFAVLKNDKTTKVVKIAASPIDLFDSIKFKEALNGHTATVFLGHNRLATKGVINNTNAHPYEFDHIVGAHNGTLDMQAWKALEKELGEDFPVDSMAIIAGIARLGIEKVIPMLRGAWALVWIDKSDNTVNFLRNKERPFWYAYDKKCEKLFWASEWAMIHGAQKLSTTEYELWTNDNNEGYFRTEEDQWYRIPLDELKKGAASPPDFKVMELKGKEPAPVVTYTGGNTSPFPARGNQDHSTRSTMTTSMTTGGAATGGTSNVTSIGAHILHLKGSSTQPYGGFVTKKQFDDIAKFGCSYCQCDVEFDDIGVQLFLTTESVLCAECSQSEDDHNRVYTADIAN